jgi:hypothetical protein
MNSGMDIAVAPRLGHNGGPPLDEHVPEWGPGPIGTYFDWKRAYRRSRSAPRSVVMFRLARAERVGLTYEEYLLEILDRGRYLQVEDADRLAEIKGARPPTARPPAKRASVEPPASGSPDPGPRAAALRRLRRVR